MRKMFYPTLVAFGLAIAGNALAAHDPNAGPGAHDGLPGNQGCDDTDDAGNAIPLKNPGKLFQWVRSTYGVNPKRAAEMANADEGVDLNLGQWINLRCNDPEI